MEAWEKYFEVYRQAMLREPPDQTAANEYYLENRETLDAGAQVTWAARKSEEDISAIQHAMHLYCRDPDTFMAEYQNAPPSDSAQQVKVSIKHLEKKDRPLPRGVLTDQTETLTAFIDISEKVLWWMVCGWHRNFTGFIVDYGVWPEQSTTYTTLKTARRSLSHLKKGAGFEGSLNHGLDTLCEHILGREYFTENNTPHKVSLCLIDSGWGASTETVYNFCKRNRFSNILLPSKGEGITAGRNMLVDPSVKRRPMESIEGQWRIAATAKGVRIIRYDTNHWKGFSLNRLAEPAGNVGSVCTFQGNYSRHRMLFEQLTAEYSVRTEGRGRVVDEYKCRPNRDNHLLDCLVGCGVAASVRGCSISRTLQMNKKKDAPKKPKKKSNVTYF
jgi:phage terminase large subunit GpA-like protein